MKLSNKETILKNSLEILSNIYDSLNNLDSISIKEFNPKRTIAFSIDVNNGFAKSGAMSSNRVEAIINDSAKTLRALSARGVQLVAYTDTHTKESPEFLMYPEHCLEGTEEQMVVEEISSIEGILIKPKNSTNGFLAYNPLNQKEMEYPNLTQEDLDNMDTFIVTGDCTDICVYQFAISLKTYLDQCNRRGTIIIPVNLVETFDAPYHNGDFMNMVFLNSLAINGVKLVSEIR